MSSSHPPVILYPDPQFSRHDLPTTETVTGDVAEVTLTPFTLIPVRYAHSFLRSRTGLGRKFEVSGTGQESVVLPTFRHVQERLYKMKISCLK